MVVVQLSPSVPPSSVPPSSEPPSSVPPSSPPLSPDPSSPPSSPVPEPPVASAGPESSAADWSPDTIVASSGSTNTHPDERLQRTNQRGETHMGRLRGGPEKYGLNARPARASCSGCCRWPAPSVGTGSLTDFGAPASCQRIVFDGQTTRMWGAVGSTVHKPGVG
ncbi:MAG: hypothetical protein CL927_15395 [Deltaproteobacteria bacterium]|nr:hypothetical protein [Deltaproteobacteria bacterium]